jgi:zinc transporter ZupT
MGGGIFIFIIDKIIPHLHPGMPEVSIEAFCWYSQSHCTIFQKGWR